MIRKAIIVVLTVVSLWTVYCWAGSYLPKASSTWFSCGSRQHGKQVTWNVYQGESYVESLTYNEMGHYVHRRSYRPPHTAHWDRL